MKRHKFGLSDDPTEEQAIEAVLATIPIDPDLLDSSFFLDEWWARGYKLRPGLPRSQRAPYRFRHLQPHYKKHRHAVVRRGGGFLDWHFFLYCLCGARRRIDNNHGVHVYGPWQVKRRKKWVDESID